MRIMGIFFNSFEVGGINTITSGLMDGFKKAGHDFQYFHCTPKGRLRKIDVDQVFGKRNIRLAARQFGYEDSISVKRYKHVVENEYDCVIFLNACPHYTKSSGGDDRSWQELFKVRKPVFVIFHDNLWKVYYEWLIEVKDYISGCFYTVNNAKYDSLKHFPKHHMFLPVPLDTLNSGLFSARKKENIVWLSQWKRWKGIREFLEQTPKINHDVDLYNIGIMYYDFKKNNSDWWKKIIREDKYDGVTHNKKSLVTYYALVLPSKISYVLKRAFCSIDLSGAFSDRFGNQITCSILEPMLYGAISVVHENMVSKKSILHKYSDIVYSVKMETLASDINRLFKKKGKYEKMRKKALDYVRKNHDSKDVVEKIFVPFYNMAARGDLDGVKKAKFTSNYRKMMKKDEIEKPIKSELRELPKNLNIVRIPPRAKNIVKKDK